MKNLLQYSDQKEALKVLSTGEVKQAKIAFKQLYDRHFSILYRVALRILESSDLAKDMTQEIFTNIWIERSELSKVNSFEAYLCTCTKNLAYDYFKKSTKTKAASKEYIARLQINDDPVNIERYDNVLKLVEQLPPQAKQVFELAKVEGLSYKAIAERLHISTITVNHHMSFAIKFLKQRQAAVRTSMYWLSIFSIF